jgi:hypothetical protein
MAVTCSATVFFVFRVAVVLVVPAVARAFVVFAVSAIRFSFAQKASRQRSCSKFRIRADAADAQY